MPEIVAPVALVTGAARRVGAHIAQQLHAVGYRVVLHYRSSQREAELLAAKLTAQRPDSIKIIPTNLLETQQLGRLIQATVESWGRIDALINNASSFFPTPIGQVTENEWDDLVGSNLKAPFFLIQAAVPWLEKTQGSVVNIIDIHAEQPYLNYSVYCSAKAGLHMLTRTLAKELAPTIRVNGVSPGTTIWPENINALSEEKKAKIIERLPLKRLANPADIAKTVHFLLTNSSITGQIISVDAGRSLI